MKQFRKTLILSTVMIFLMAFTTYAQEVIERYRLGNNIEDITYISTGDLAGKFAFADGWNVYTLDLDTREYEKLFYYGDLDLGICTRGITYISRGNFSGNFLMNDIANPNTLFIVSSSGALVSEVNIVNFQWEGRCEGLTEILSGPYQESFAMIGLSNTYDVSHIYIFQIIDEEGIVNAYLKKDIEIPVGSWEDLAEAISFIDDNYPDEDYQNHFLIIDWYGDVMGVYNDDGYLEESFSLDHYIYEGLAYINDGPYQGKLMIVDWLAEHSWLRNLDGTKKKEITPLISIGAGASAPSMVTWLETQRMFLVGRFWDDRYWHVDRPRSGIWKKNKEFTYTDILDSFDIIRLTADKKHYLLGRDGYEGGVPKYVVQRLSSNFRLEETFPIYTHCPGISFRRICYIQGATPADDKFALVEVDERKTIYLFDKTFSNFLGTFDLSEIVPSIRIYDIYYDSEDERYYVLDGKRVLRVFDMSWGVIAAYDVSDLCRGGFSNVTKITSGDSAGCFALLNADDSEIFIVRFEE